jgi:DNA-binding response OmpR family regulator
MTALRLLIVEDDALIGALLAETLEDMGYEICAIAGTEAEAIAKAFQYKPDLMIVDATLGEGSGVSAIETIAKRAFIPHLFISGDILTVKAARPDAIVVQKPFRDAELDQAIRRTLSRQH